MTDSECLAEAVRRTGHRRFLDLLDSESPAYREDYWPVVREIAAGHALDLPFPLPTPHHRVVPFDAPRIRAAVHCLYRECGTGCQATRCWAGYGDVDEGRRCTLSHCQSCIFSASPSLHQSKDQSI